MAAVRGQDYEEIENRARCGLCGPGRGKLQEIEGAACRRTVGKQRKCFPWRISHLGKTSAGKSFLNWEEQRSRRREAGKQEPPASALRRTSLGLGSAQAGRKSEPSNFQSLLSACILHAHIEEASRWNFGHGGNSFLRLLPAVLSRARAKFLVARFRRTRLHCRPYPLRVRGRSLFRALMGCMRWIRGWIFLRRAGTHWMRRSRSLPLSRTIRTMIPSATAGCPTRRARSN